MQHLLILLILDPLYNGFGWAMKYLYDWLQNYGLVIIVFNVLIKIVLLPLDLKVQRGMTRQRFLTDDINEIKRVYANDPQQANAAQMQLMKDSGVSVASGCLPSILSFIVLIAMWRPFYQPLYYVGRVPMDYISKMADLLGITNFAANDVGVIQGLRDNATALATSVQNGWVTLSQLPDLNFLGFNLGLTPTINPALLFGAETWRTYVPLLILVLVMLATMVLSMRMTRLVMPRGASKEEKERAKKNPAKKDQLQEQTGEGVMKTMNYTMPILMIFTALTVPAAMCLFWIVSNIMAIVTTLLKYQLYTKPADALLAEQNAQRMVPKRRKNA